MTTDALTRQIISRDNTFSEGIDCTISDTRTGIRLSNLHITQDNRSPTRGHGEIKFIVTFFLYSEVQEVSQRAFHHLVRIFLQVAFRVQVLFQQD